MKLDGVEEPGVEVLVLEAKDPITQRAGWNRIGHHAADWDLVVAPFLLAVRKLHSAVESVGDTLRLSAVWTHHECITIEHSFPVD